MPARNDVERGRGKMVPIDGRFGYAVSKAVERTGETIKLMALGFLKVLGGDSPSESLGGPLTMYRVASVSGEQGWDSFLLLIALISVNLGLINLLPVPVLDGGHVLVFVIEGVSRRRGSPRAKEKNQAGGRAVKTTGGFIESLPRRARGKGSGLSPVRSEALQADPQDERGNRRAQHVDRDLREEESRR